MKSLLVILSVLVLSNISIADDHAGKTEETPAAAAGTAGTMEKGHGHAKKKHMKKNAKAGMKTTETGETAPAAEAAPETK